MNSFNMRHMNDHEHHVRLYASVTTTIRWPLGMVIKL